MNFAVALLLPALPFLKEGKWLGQKVDLGTPDSLKPRIRERVMREVVRAA